jgi:hypothetical protein
MTDNFERALQERLLARSQVSARDVEALRLFARTIPARRSLWQRPALRWAMSAAAIVIAAVIALPLLNRIPGVGTESPAPSSPAPTSPAASPSTPIATPVPSVGVGAIRLLTASGSAVDVVISDPDALVTDAAAAQAEATMSVRWFESIVEPVGPSSIMVKWVGFPEDETVRLEVSRTDSDGLLLHFVQDGPPPDSDGVGEDRILVLDLGEPVDPNDVEVTFSTP